jgi:hypothetical protein
MRRRPTRCRRSEPAVADSADGTVTVTDATRDMHLVRQRQQWLRIPARTRVAAPPGLHCPASVWHLPPPGAIAQLGERLDRTQEVAGSSPASSMLKAPQNGAFCLPVWTAPVCRRRRGYQTGTCETGGSVRSAGRARLELQTRRAGKDSVVRDERNPWSDRGGSDPAIGRVLLLAERVAGGYAVCAKLCVDRHKLRSAVTTSTRSIVASILSIRGLPQPRRIAPYRSSAAVWNEMNASRPVMSGA